MQTTRRTLSDDWRVREVPPDHVPEHNHLPWLPAQVPGHIHIDLARAGVIPDPFARLHERAIAWIDDRDWIYETTFHVEDFVPAHAFLKFHGLDTVAEIELNGKRLGETDNMFVPHEFPVGGRLRVGENTLRITFRSALRVGRERQQAWVDAGETVPGAHWDWFGPRSFVRKAQYMYGWDWGPVLLGCGIWQPVELVIVPIARIGDWKYDVEFTDSDQAIITVTVNVERAPGQENTPLSLTLNLPSVGFLDGDEDFGDVLPTPVARDVPAGSGILSSTATLTVSNPRRWNPNGLNQETLFDGSHPPLYTLTLALTANEIEADICVTKIGLRTMELVREPDVDGQGEGFKFRINSHDVFIKGANWIPNDSFPSRITRDSLRQRIEQACDTGFNMLRVWGGGFYESEDFYDLCDEHGILVWQDFPYACAQYPDTPYYQAIARDEATAAVRRIRNHPSLALWCGNNENDWAYRDWGWARDGDRDVRFLGEALYHDVLPAVVAAEDPKTPYWPSSPFGGDDPNAQTQGDCHNWDVWHGRGDWTHYPENDARFCSEFGFAASCGLAAWDTVLAPEDRHPYSAAVKWHDKTRKGYETYLGYSALHFPDPQTLEDLVYFTQLNQAEALKFGVEHYRRRKGHCWGTLFWQFNDCWPAQTWAIVDSLGEPKAAYYAAKRFYAPVLLSLVRDGETVTAHLVNDFTHAVEGLLTISLERLDGGPSLSLETQAVMVGPNGAAPVATFSISAARGREHDLYIYGQFQPGAAGATLENYLFLVEPKDLRLSDPGLSLSVAEGNDACFAVTLTARRFAPYVWLRRRDNLPLELSDNFFHLRPGETRQIFVPRLSDIASMDALRGLLSARTL